jgi:cytochrome c oxidase subunit 2
MNWKRAGLVTLLGVALLFAVTGPAAAQAATDSTTTEEAIWGLNSKLIYVAVPITVLVEGILIYTVWKYRKSDEAKPTQENRRLEITWTIATAVILLFVGAASYQVLGNPYVSAESQQQLDTEQEPLEVQVYGQKYNWEFVYPEQDISTTETLVIPTDRPVRLNVTSRDWLHSFHVPGLGLKADAFPGQSNFIVTRAQETGTHQLYCAEYCGVGHSGMLGTVEVRSQEGFQEWAAQHQSSESSGSGDSMNATSGNSTSSALVAPAAP